MYKYLFTILFSFLFSFAFMLIAQPAWAANTGNTTGYAWSERVGWIRFDGAGSSQEDYGVTIGDTVVSGYAWSENAGWIHMASTSASCVQPGGGCASGYAYNVAATTDCAVGSKCLSGYAWGQGVGWISFATSTTDYSNDSASTYGVYIDNNDNFQGYAWGEQVGWIHFSGSCSESGGCPGGVSSYGVEYLPDLVGIEQQINIIDQNYNNDTAGYLPSDNSLGLVKWDGSKYDGETVYFEALLNDGVSWGRIRYDINLAGVLSDNTNYTVRIKLDTNCYASLYSEAGVQVAESEISTSTASACHIKAARLIIVQADAAEITKTVTMIEVGDATSTYQTSMTQLEDKKIYLYDHDQFDPEPTAYFEATVRGDIKPPLIIIAASSTYASGGTEDIFNLPMPDPRPDGDLYIAVITKDDDLAPSWTNPPAGMTTLYSFESDNNIWFSVYWWIGSSEPAFYEITGDGEEYSAAVIRIDGSTVNTSDPIIDSDFAQSDAGEPIAPSVTPDVDGSLILYLAGTDTVTWDGDIYPPGTTGLLNLTTTGGGNGSAQTAVAYQTGLAAHEASGLKSFDTTGNDECATVSIALRPVSDQPATVYAELYNKTDFTTVAGSSISTTSADWVLVRGTSPLSTNWDTAADDEYVVRISSDTSGTSVYIANAKIILEQIDSGGVIDKVEMVHQYINTKVSESGATFTAQNFNNFYNANNFSGGAFSYYFEATLKNNTSTSAGRLNPGDLGAVGGSFADWTRSSSTGITLIDDTNYDSEIQYADVSTSWLVIRALGLRPVTAPYIIEDVIQIEGDIKFD